MWNRVCNHWVFCIINKHAKHHVCYADVCTTGVIINCYWSWLHLKSVLFPYYHVTMEYLTMPRASSSANTHIVSTSLLRTANHMILYFLCTTTYIHYRNHITYPGLSLVHCTNTCTYTYTIFTQKQKVSKALKIRLLKHVYNLYIYISYI
jgi:hypothetical protein